MDNTSNDIWPSPVCPQCGRSGSPIGKASKPSKSFFICERCWLKYKKSLFKGHGYTWVPQIKQGG